MRAIRRRSSSAVVTAFAVIASAAKQSKVPARSNPRRQSCRLSGAGWPAFADFSCCSLHSAAYAVEADDPARNRCGCFLPDLTRLATTPSADFRWRIWWKPADRASSCPAEASFSRRSRAAGDVIRIAMPGPRSPSSFFSPLPARRRRSPSPAINGRRSSAPWASRFARERQPTTRSPTGSSRQTATVTDFSPPTKW